MPPPLSQAFRLRFLSICSNLRGPRAPPALPALRRPRGAPCSRPPRPPSAPEVSARRTTTPTDRRGDRCRRLSHKPSAVTRASVIGNQKLPEQFAGHPLRWRTPTRTGVSNVSGAADASVAASVARAQLVSVISAATDERQARRREHAARRVERARATTHETDGTASGLLFFETARASSHVTACSRASARTTSPPA